jgi:hypothetical protein
VLRVECLISNFGESGWLKDKYVLTCMMHVDASMSIDVDHIYTLHELELSAHGAR